MPTFQAYSPSRSSVEESAPATTAPRRTQVENRPAVFAVDQEHVIGLGHLDGADVLELQQLAFDHGLSYADQQSRMWKLRSRRAIWKACM